MYEDEELNELIFDLTAGEDDRSLVVAYLKAFLPRFSRRVEKKYPAQDSFAAACTGARRLVQHIGFDTQHQSILSIERTLAQTISAGMLEMAALSSAIDKHTIEVVTSTDPYANSVLVQHIKEPQRGQEIDRLTNECLQRVDEWSPDVAQESSRLRAKNRGRRERGLSLCAEIEIARANQKAMNRSEEVLMDSANAFVFPRKLSADNQPARKKSVDQTKNAPIIVLRSFFSDSNYSPSLTSKQTYLQPSFIPPRNNSSDAINSPRLTSINDGLIPMLRSESTTDDSKRKWYQRKAPQETSSLVKPSAAPPLHTMNQRYPQFDSSTHRGPSDAFRRLPMDLSMQRSQSNDSIAIHMFSSSHQAIPFHQRRPSTDFSYSPTLLPRKQSIDAVSSPLLGMRVAKKPVVMFNDTLHDGERDGKSSNSYESKSSGSYKSDVSTMYEYHRKMSFGGSAVLGSLSEAGGDQIENAEQRNETDTGDSRRGSAEAMLQLLQDEIESMNFEDMQ